MPLFCISELSPESALVQADTDYQAANIHQTIQQYLTAPSQEHSIEGYVGFIMATDIGFFILVSVMIVISYQLFSATSSAISVFRWST